MLTRRNALKPAMRARRSAVIGRCLRGLEAYRAAGTVMFYVTHGSEVKTERMMERAWLDRKTVVVPVADPVRRRLAAGKISCWRKDLAAQTYGIREPRPGMFEPVNPRTIDLVVVPGVAFDEKGYRIGYGKGYYDSWLPRFPMRRRVGLAYDFQVMTAVPRSGHDAPVGIVVTEKRIVIAGGNGRKRKTGHTMKGATR